MCVCERLIGERSKGAHRVLTDKLRRGRSKNFYKSSSQSAPCALLHFSRTNRAHHYGSSSRLPRQSRGDKERVCLASTNVCIKLAWHLPKQAVEAAVAMHGYVRATVHTNTSTQTLWVPNSIHIYISHCLFCLFYCLLQSLSLSSEATPLQIMARRRRRPASIHCHGCTDLASLILAPPPPPPQASHNHHQCTSRQLPSKRDGCKLHKSVMERCIKESSIDAKRAN